jgi:hypothetical protein
MGALDDDARIGPRNCLAVPSAQGDRMEDHMNIFEQVTGIRDAGVTGWMFANPWAPFLLIAVVSGAIAGYWLVMRPRV